MACRLILLSLADNVTAFNSPAQSAGDLNPKSYL
jgi:hypothetical protein